MQTMTVHGAPSMEKANKVKSCRTERDLQCTLLIFLHTYATDYVIIISVYLLNCGPKKVHVSDLDDDCDMQDVDQHMRAYPVYVHMLTFVFDIMQVGMGLQICGSPQIWGWNASRKCDI